MKGCQFPSTNAGKLEFSKQARKSRIVCWVFRFFLAVCLFKIKAKHLSSKKAEEQEDDLEQHSSIPAVR